MGRWLRALPSSTPTVLRQFCFLCPVNQCPDHTVNLAPGCHGPVFQKNAGSLHHVAQEDLQAPEVIAREVLAASLSYRYSVSLK